MLPEKAIEAAVGWWGSALENPTFSNGSLSQSALATVVSSDVRKKLSIDEIERFKVVLAEKLSFMKEECWLTVDYHPCAMLTDAAMGSFPTKFGDYSFPWKTSMSITATYVEVSRGYRAEFERIWGNRFRISCMYFGDREGNCVGEQMVGKVIDCRNGEVLYSTTEDAAGKGSLHLQQSVTYRCVVWLKAEFGQEWWSPTAYPMEVDSE